MRARQSVACLCQLVHIGGVTMHNRSKGWHADSERSRGTTPTLIPWQACTFSCGGSCATLVVSVYLRELRATTSGRPACLLMSYV